MKRHINLTNGKWMISWLIPTALSGWFRIHVREATPEEVAKYGDSPGPIPAELPTATFVSPDGEEFEI